MNNKTEKILKKNRESIKSRSPDGKVIVIILDTIMNRGNMIRKQLAKEEKKKVMRPDFIHDLRIRSLELSELTDELLVKVTKFTKRKKK